MELGDDVRKLYPAYGGPVELSGLEADSGTLVGRYSADTGLVEQVQPADARDLLGLGDLALIDLPSPATGLFLRDDGTWAAPGGGGSVEYFEAEIEFLVAADSASFVVTHSGAVTAGAKIMVCASGNMPTGVDDDEWEMDALMLTAKAGPGANEITVYAHATPGPVTGKRNILYSIGA